MRKGYILGVTVYAVIQFVLYKFFGFESTVMILLVLISYNVIYIVSQQNRKP